jgi:hypothetical protein
VDPLAASAEDLYPVKGDLGYEVATEAPLI